MQSRQFAHGIRGRQRGIALMLLMLLAIVTASAIFIAALGQPGTRNALQEQERTLQALQQAKEALIAYAANQKNLPGQLPCPEDTSLIGTPNEGNAISAIYCGVSPTLPAVGPLPWRTLNLRDLRDANGDRLWYAISPGFRAAPINSNTIGQLAVDGAANQTIAIIFSAGTALTGQSRPVPTAGTPPLRSNYLDLSNNASLVPSGPFVTSGPIGQFNDKLLIVTTDDLLRVLERRVLADVAFALKEYVTCGNGNAYMSADGTCVNLKLCPPDCPAIPFYPRPASFADTQCLGISTIAAGCTEVGVTGGRLPATTNYSVSGDISWGTYSLLRNSTAGNTDVRGATANNNWFQANGWRELIYYAVDPNCTTSACATGTIALSNPAFGITVNNKVVLVMAGRALTGQVRVAGNPDKTTEANYLEDYNLLNLPTGFAAIPPSGVPYNDIALGIP
jgi:hypothetical protein